MCVGFHLNKYTNCQTNIDQFKYVESSVTKDAYFTKEIRSRIAVAKSASPKNGLLFTRRHLSKELRKDLAI